MADQEPLRTVRIDELGLTALGSQFRAEVILGGPEAAQKVAQVRRVDPGGTMSNGGYVGGSSKVFLSSDGTSWDSGDPKPGEPGAPVSIIQQRRRLPNVRLVR
jgi:hypothetical protein